MWCIYIKPLRCVKSSLSLPVCDVNLRWEYKQSVHAEIQAFMQEQTCSLEVFAGLLTSAATQLLVPPHKAKKKKKRKETYTRIHAVKNWIKHFRLWHFWDCTFLSCGVCFSRYRLWQLDLVWEVWQRASSLSCLIYTSGWAEAACRALKATWTHSQLV